MAPFSFAPLGRKGFKTRSSSRVRAYRDQVRRAMQVETEMKERQREVKEKLEALNMECEELKRETRFIIQQSGTTQIKLALIFRILKAREAGDMDSAATQTRLLREIVAREEEARKKVI